MAVSSMAVIFYLASFIVATQCSASDFIPLDYSSDIPPPPKAKDGKHHVQLSIQFINLMDVNELEGFVQFSCFFRVFWNDSRVYPQNISKKGPVRIPASVAARLWRPDVITENVRNVVKNGIIKPTIYNGRFWGKLQFVSKYLSMKISCSFQYHDHPFDVQMCRLHFTNMGMTTADVHLNWTSPPYQMDRNTFLTFQDRFVMRLCEDQSNPVRRTKLGEHPQKTLFIIMERNVMTYVVQLFLPSIMFVLIAWLSILVPPTMLRTRLLLNSTNLLTVLSMFVAISHADATYIPKVSYLTALSLWMYVCVTFVFSSMLVVMFDIRLIAMLTHSRHSQRVGKLVLDVYHRRRSTRQGSLPTPPADQLGEEDEADAPAAAATAATAAAAAALEPKHDPPAEDAEGDLFMDASSRPVKVRTPAAAATAEKEELERRLHHRRHLWLELTAFYERMYLVAFPVLFAVFLTIFFCVYVSRRRQNMERFLGVVRANSGGHYTGCFCTDSDEWAGCMDKDEYDKK